MPPVESVAAISDDLILRLSIEQYHAMIQAGILTDDDPVELLEGLLVFKIAKNLPHRLATNLARTALENILHPGWYVDSQEPITLQNSEPEDEVISCLFMDENRFLHDNGPLLRNIRKEGIAL